MYFEVDCIWNDSTKCHYPTGDMEKRIIYVSCVYCVCFTHMREKKTAFTTNATVARTLNISAIKVADRTSIIQSHEELWCRWVCSVINWNLIVLGIWTGWITNDLRISRQIRAKGRRLLLMDLHIKAWTSLRLRRRSWSSVRSTCMNPLWWFVVLRINVQDSHASWNNVFGIQPMKTEYNVSWCNHLHWDMLMLY